MNADDLKATYNHAPIDNHNDYQAGRQATTAQKASVTPDHFWDCVNRRGLDATWVVANCRSVTASEASELLGYPAKSDGIMLIGANGQVQFRPDVPWESVDENGKVTKPKYRSPKGDYDVMLPTCPSDPNYWNDLEALKEKAWKVNGRPCLVITEGMFKAIAGCSNGVPTIALLGVEMGLTPKKKDPDEIRHLVPGLQKFVDAGFDFIICFDADIVSKKGVQVAEKTLESKLKVTNNNVYSVSGAWKIGKDGIDKGMDDYIKNHGADEFKREVMGKVVDTAPWEKQFNDAKRSNSPGKSRGDFNAERVAGKIAEKYRIDWAYHNEQQIWRHFNGKIWEAVHDKVFKQVVKRELDSNYPGYESSSKLRDVVELLETELLIPAWQTFSRHQWIAFNNGVLNLGTMKLEPHAPGFRFTNHLPRDYSPIIVDETLDTIAALNKHCPNFYQWAMSAMGNDAKKVYKLAAIINGVLRFKFFDWQMFVHLVGEPGSGKGTFTHILEDLVGNENAKTSKLAKLSVDTELARIIGAQLVICPDEDKKVGEHGQLKAMTGGDKISYREIYKQGAESFFYGALVVVSNFPIFAGETTGIDRRLCLVHFANAVPAHRRDPKLRDRIVTELPALTSIALAMDETSVAESVKGIGNARIAAFRLHEWEMKIQSDALAAFIEECCIKSPGDAISINDSFKPYLDHANESNAKGTYKIQNFSQKLLEYLKWLGWDCEKVRTKYGYKIKGFRLRTDADGDIPYAGDTLLPVGVDQCRPGVGSGVDLKPAQGKDSVDGVGLEPINCEVKQLSLTDPPPNNPEPVVEPEKNPVIKQEGLEPTPSTLSSPSKGFESTPGSTPGLHHPTPEPAPANGDSFKIGDRVYWNNCPGHVEQSMPTTIRDIKENFAYLDWVEIPVPLSYLRKVK